MAVTKKITEDEGKYGKKESTRTGRKVHERGNKGNTTALEGK